MVEGTDVIALGNIFGEVVKQDVLKKEHRVVIPNGGLHQAFGIGGGTDRHDFDAWHSVEIGLKPLAVFCAQLAADPTGATHNGGNCVIATTRVAQHPHVVGDLVEGEQ